MNVELEEKFALSLKGNGVSIEKDVDRRTALTIVTAVMGEGGVAAQLGAASVGSASNPKPEMSLREFLIDAAPSTNKERIVAIALYLLEQKGKETFSMDDIRGGFRSAREQLPKNLARDIGSALTGGWIDGADQKGQYIVTNTGSEAVKSHFGRRSAV